MVGQQFFICMLLCKVQENFLFLHLVLLSPLTQPISVTIDGPVGGVKDL